MRLRTSVKYVNPQSYDLWCVILQIYFWAFDSPLIIKWICAYPLMVHYTYIGKNVQKKYAFFSLLYLFQKDINFTIGFLSKYT